MPSNGPISMNPLRKLKNLLRRTPLPPPRTLPPNIQLWVDALRSGKYEQGTGWLARRDSPTDTYKYCCLGVACDVAVKNGLDLDVTEQQYGGASYFEYNARDVSLPLAVADWLGVDGTSIYLPNPHQNRIDKRREVPAITLNDDFLCSFAVIADAIEKKYFLKEKGQHE